jgi:hypothetical protein
VKTKETTLGSHGGGVAIGANWFHWRRKRFWLLAALLAYTLLGFFAAPPLIRWLAISNIEKTGRTVTLEHVRVNPFTLTILAEGAEVRDTDDEVILSYDEYFWNFQASSLFRWAWTFKEIRLAGLYVHEERFGELDTRFTRLIRSFGEPESTPETTEANGLPRMIIDRFSLRDGRIRLTDRLAGDFESTLGPINVEVNDLRTLPDHSGQHSVSIRTQQGGHVEWRGSLQALPFASQGHLSVTGRGLADVMRYAEHFLPFRVLGDSISVDLDYHAGIRDGALFLSVENLQTLANGGRIRPDGSDEDTLQIRELSIAGGSLEWPEQFARLENVRAEGLALKAGLLPDGSIDLMALVPSAPPKEAPAADKRPWTLEIGALGISSATIHLTDETLSPPVRLSLEDFELELSDVDNRPGTSMPVQVSTRLSSGGALSYGGQLQALPEIRSEGRVTLEQVQLSVAQPYITPRFRVALNAGSLDLAAELRHHSEQPMELVGDLRVDNLLVHDSVQNERLLAWEALQLDRFELDVAVNTLVTSELELAGLFGRLHIAEDLSTNVSQLVVGRNDEDEGESTTPSLPDLQFGGVELMDAALDFSDEISAISSTSSEPARVKLEGQVNEFGQAQINGQIKPLAPTELASIDVAFRNLDLSRLTPYTIQFAGYAIDDGRMELDLAYRVDQRKLNGDNRIIIREIELGEKSDHPKAGNLPLGLAVALLTDANGVIDLDLPVEGDLDDPQFKISGVVWQALGNLISKAVTAPFRLLGNLVGIDAEDFGTLYFGAGRSDITPPDREQLLKLAEAMLQRPELTVEVGGVYATEADAEALRIKAVESMVNQRSGELPIGKNELSTDHEQRVLESLMAEQLPDLDLAAIRAELSQPAEGSQAPVLDQPAYLARLRTHLQAEQAVGDAELAALANARAAAALAALRESRPAMQLRAVQADPREVDFDSTRGIPLELSVRAGD